MTTLIGRRCTHSNVFSRPVLIGRGLGTIMPVLAMEFSGVEDPLLTNQNTEISGGHSGGVTPVPIPNTEVKPASADGTWGETPWESRSPPDFSRKSPRQRGLFRVLGTIPTCRPDRADRRRLRPADRRGPRGERARDRRAGAASPVAGRATSG